MIRCYKMSVLLVIYLCFVTVGCAVPPPVRTDVLITTADDIPEGVDRCLFGNGGPWRVLKLWPSESPNDVLTFIAIFPPGVPIDLSHILCLIPVDDPIMSLRDGKKT